MSLPYDGNGGVDHRTFIKKKMLRYGGKMLKEALEATSWRGLHSLNLSKAWELSSQARLGKSWITYWASGVGRMQPILSMRRRLNDKLRAPCEELGFYLEFQVDPWDDPHLFSWGCANPVKSKRGEESRGAINIKWICNTPRNILASFSHPFGCTNGVQSGS